MFNKIYQTLCKITDYAIISIIVMACLSMILQGFIMFGDKLCRKGETHNYVRYMDTKYLYCTKCLTVLDVEVIKSDDNAKLR